MIKDQRWTTDTSIFITSQSADPGYLAIHDKIGVMVRVSLRGDGEVVIREGATPDEAARKFWEAVGMCFPVKIGHMAREEKTGPVQYVVTGVADGVATLYGGGETITVPAQGLSVGDIVAYSGEFTNT